MCGSAPTPPDPTQVAAAQTQSNDQTAQTQAKLNAVDQTNPFGSSVFTRDANGDPTGQTASLNPQLQQLLQGLTGVGGTITNTAGSVASNLPSTNIDTSGFAPTVDATANAAFNQQKGMLEPGFDIQNQNLDTMLTDRGLPVGGEAWNQATKAQQTNQNNALDVAANSAQVSGAQEQNTLFGQAVTKQQTPYNDLAQLLSMNPSSGLIGSAPGAISTSPTAVNPTNVGQITQNSYQDQLAAYNQQQQQLAGGLLGLATIGLSGPVGAGFGLTGGQSLIGSALSSDKNLKENRKPTNREAILLDLSKLPVDHYDYKKDAQKELHLPASRVGPMAQDWAKAFGGDGKTIDFGDMAGKMLAAIQALESRTSHLSEKRA